MQASAPIGGRESDLILAPGEYVHAMDTTKGILAVYVGPYISGLSGNTIPVMWDGKQLQRHSKFEGTVQRFTMVEEGQYVVLTNPAKEQKDEHPKEGSNSLVELDSGRRVNIPGPAYFALWPRQCATVIPGHQLRTNQYLVVRVFNDADAMENWDQGIIKSQTLPQTGEGEAGEEEEQGDKSVVKPAQLTTGQLLIIKGTEVSFYIPPTGIEVVPDKSGKFVRDAVTLERMEYCILLGEDGNKRFVEGPEVVFPKPTESFIEVGGAVRFKPIELNENSGLYIKVIADYKGDGGRKHKAGEELFITGKEQAIYYPRPEHSIVQYGDQMIHFAVAVPKGEGRYVLDRIKGNVRLVKGPTMLLPDPRKEVVVRRVLDENQVALWYPGNAKAQEVNRTLRKQLEALGGPEGLEYLASISGMETRGALGLISSRAAPEAIAAETIRRRTEYTPPRTVTLDTKYEGAVHINVWPGYAVLVVDKSGNREVVEGPAAILLEYDQVLMPMELSTGTPKSDENLLRTVYLQIHSNRVSDMVSVETSDLVGVDLVVAYRVNFEGEDPLKWFDVDNYTRFLTEHVRSLLRNAVKQQKIEDFYRDPITVVRDAILGKADSAGAKRSGRKFDENGMRVYEVDVLGVKIKNSDVAELLEDAQTEALQTTLRIAAKERELDATQRGEALERQIAEEQSDSAVAKMGLQITEVRKRLDLNLAEVEAETQKARQRLEAKKEGQGLEDAIAAANREREKAEEEQRLTFAKAEAEQVMEKWRAETEEIVKRAGAVSPELIAALQAFSDKDLVARVAEAMAPLAIVRNTAVFEVLGTLLKGTPLEKIAGDFVKRMSKQE